MKNSLRLISVGIALALSATITPAASAVESGQPGSTASNPIVVATPDAVPSTAVEDATSTYVTAGACDTTRSWVDSTSGTNQTTHEEFRFLREVPATFKTQYRWPLERRTYTPGQTEQSHMVYAYKRTVQDTRTRYWFAKYTHTKTKPRGGSWSAYGPWTKWEPETHTSWEWSTTPLGQPAYHGSGTYSNGTEWYREWQAQYTGRSEQVVVGSHEEFSGERTTTLGSPWVLLSGYPKRVVDSPAVPASFGPWTADGYSAWSDSSAAPADPDGQSGDTNPANLRRVGSPMQSQQVKTGEAYTEFYVAGAAPTRVREAASWVTSWPAGGWMQFDQRVVGDNNATPGAVTYYAWSDGKACLVPPVTKPRVDVESRCTGTTTFVLDNRKSEPRVPFTMRATKGKRVIWSKTVPMRGGRMNVVVKSLPNGARATITALDARASVIVPKPCPKPPHHTPHTGK